MSTGDALPYPYSIKRHGVSITHCDAEPVQTPGCIQAHGVMLALRPDDLVVSQASENVGAWIGRSVESVLDRPVDEVIGAEAADRIRLLARTESLERNPLYALTVTLPDGPAGSDPLDLSVHLCDGVLILEMEPTGRLAAPAAPKTDYYALVKKTLSRLKSTRTLADFCESVAQETRRVTGLDRAMVYRFHADDSGEVVADAHREDLHSWLGLRYPADDIPRPAREIFKRIGIRPLPDASGALCEMVPLLNPATGRALDMTYCALRGPSVMYTEYLQNMGVAATLTMPILRDGDLWGLIACHHCSPVAMPYEVRAAAEFIGQVASLEIGPAEAREDLQYRLRLDAVHHAVLARAALHVELGVMVDGTPGLLEGLDACGVAILSRGQWSLAGQTPTVEQLAPMAEFLRQRIEPKALLEPVFHTDALVAIYPAAAEFADRAAGVLAVPVSVRPYGDLILWFRPEQVQTLNWAGNPHAKPTVTGTHGARLTPRQSFEIWQETVRGRSVAWKPVEVETALKLRSLVMNLVVRHSEHLAELNIELTRNNEELDAFAYIAGHDLKEPLRGIHKYAHLLAEENKLSSALDRVSKERIGTLLRLAVRMDGLLDALLHYSRVGRVSPQHESVDLGEALVETRELLTARLDDANVDLRVPRPLPSVVCDRVRIREVLSNLISNGLKYNDKPLRWVEVGYVDPGEQPPTIGGLAVALPEDRDDRVFYVRDNGIGIEQRHRERVFQIFKRLHPRDAYGGGSGAGLAIAKKLVEQHKGRLWFESEPHVGTIFFFTLSGADEQTKERTS
ncbi:MAG: ATP-binding protein [Caldimonas sp.]